MTVIVDYGVGNLFSLQSSLRALGVEAEITCRAERLREAERIILPGVGAFGDTMENLRAQGLEEPIKAYIQSGRPFLGICLGLQVLFESSEESPGVPGLGVLKGKIVRLPEGPGLKIPHIGWNSLDIRRPGGLFAGQGADPFVYFVHSYYLQAEEDVVTATAEYGVTIPAAVEKGNLWACQFHPEESGEAGLQMLRSFCGKVEQEVKIQRG